MTKLLEKQILRTLPIFYVQATATKPRRVVFSILLLWALVDGVLIFRDWRRGLPLWATAFGILLSFLGSLLFIGLLAVTWDLLVRRFGRATRF